MAVMGRTKSYLYFWYQDAMLASIIALPSMKNNLTSVSRLWFRLRESAWAKMKSWPGREHRERPVGPVLGLGLLGVVEVGGVVSSPWRCHAWSRCRPGSWAARSPGTGMVTISPNGLTLSHCGVSALWIA